MLTKFTDKVYHNQLIRDWQKTGVLRGVQKKDRLVCAFAMQESENYIETTLSRTMMLKGYEHLAAIAMRRILEEELHFDIELNDIKPFVIRIIKDFTSEYKTRYKAFVYDMRIIQDLQIPGFDIEAEFMDDYLKHHMITLLERAFRSRRLFIFKDYNHE